ncbi:restriction endonuclease subunit S [Flavobacterium sp. ZB4P13]|uniref:restriction endonuclease subunit S n=1 Tax=Flavobacterium sp. ZB4P13 TaxID=3401728 RepID=UPI003AB00F4C
MSTATLQIEKKKTLVPQLRFQEFDGEWKNRSMRDFTKINQDSKFQFQKDSMKNRMIIVFILPMNFLRKDSAKSYFIKNPSASVICYEDDILMTRTGNTGQVVTGVHGAFHNNFFKIKYDETCDKWFLYFFLTSHKTQHTILKLAGASTIPDLNHGDFYKITLNIPTFPEQQKIASFLSAVDEKIQQLSRKKELLEQYKKGVMQQLFSGELRFKDENGKDYADWEEKKLGEVAKFYKGKGMSKSEISEDGKNECIRYGELYTRYGEVIQDVFSKTNFDINKAVVSQANDVIIPASGETQIDIATASCVMKSGVILGGDLNIIRTNNNGVFLSYYLNSARKLDIANLAQGISVVHLYSSQLALLNLNLPTLPEQQKIANFLSSIDVKIESTNQQINQTQSFKKGLLQQMFV